MSRKSDAYIGKCKSNFVGTEFTMWDSGGNPQTLKGGEEVCVCVCMRACVHACMCVRAVKRRVLLGGRAWRVTGDLPRVCSRDMGRGEYAPMMML